MIRAWFDTWVKKQMQDSVFARAYRLARAEVKQDQARSFERQMDALLDSAAMEGKVVSPAERASWKRDAIVIGGGKPSKNGVAWLSAHLATVLSLPRRTEATPRPRRAPKKGGRRS